MILVETNVISEPLRPKADPEVRDTSPFEAAGLTVINPWNPR